MLALLAFLCAQQGPGPIDLPRLLAEMADRGAPARFPDPPYRAHSTSSRDPVVRVARAQPGPSTEPDPAAARDARVLLDAEGPGVITRFWCADPAGRLRIVVDGGDVHPGESRSFEWDLHDLTSGQGPIGPPFATAEAHGTTLCFPIAFAKRIHVTLDGEQAPDYELEWRSYAASVAVESFSGDALERHAPAIASARSAWAAAPIPIGELASTYHLSREAPEGELLAQNLTAARGPRAVSELRLRIDAADPARALRTSVLRLTFDGETTVSLPLGALFGAHEDLRPLRTRYTSVDATGELVARFVMPYRESFDLRVDNAGDPELHLSGAVRTIPWTWNERSLHFHATWRSSQELSARPSQPIALARITGRGVLLGEFLAIANPVTEWWGDGGATIAVDSTPLALRPGAGAHGAYGFGEGATTFQAPLHGRSRRDGPADFGRTDVYRFRALDAVPFEQRLDFAQELVHANAPSMERASCVVYYARPGAKDDAPPVPRDPSASLPKLPFRRVEGAVELESATLVAQSAGLVLERRTSRDIELSGGLQLCLLATQDEEFAEFEIPARPGRRSLRLLAAHGPGEGALRISIDGKEAVTTTHMPRSVGGVAEIESIALGEHDVGSKFRLRVQYARTSTADDDPPCWFGLDAIVVR